jgi:hypothetical protein
MVLQVLSENPGAPTMNVRKHQPLAPWEVPELKIQERPA